MFADDRKDGGSPRFGKLHIPFGLWINSPKKHFVKLGKRWPSAGSVKSTSSETGSRTSETVELRQAARPRGARQHKRASQLFARGRWASEKKLAEAGSARGGAAADEEEEEEEEEELSVQPGAPGVLKIFGEHICPGANYKSVLATARSSAGVLVKEVLARYSMGQAQPSDFLLCDVVGKADGLGGDWRTECLRAVGEAERPLVLQEMWRPRQGYSRRFEIHRREDLERMRLEEQEDTVTEGINAQARKLQLGRARVSAGGPETAGDRAEGGALRRSISEANLNAKRKKERKNVKSMLVLDVGGARRSEETDRQDQDLTCEQEAQTLLRPPSDLPYFLLLQGYDVKQDLVLHLMGGKKHVFGRGGGPSSIGGERVNTALCAPDILPRHCCVRRVEQPGRGLSAVVRAYRGAQVTRNGGLLRQEAQLLSGDLLGLGEHFLLMYKDPGAACCPPVWLPAPGASPEALREAFSCPMCGRALQEEQEAFRAYLRSREPLLRFQPEDEGEVGLLLAEIVGRAGRHDDEGGDGFKLAPAYLFAMCLQYLADVLEPRRLPALLLKIAKLVKKTAWEKIKEIGDKQPEKPGAPDVPLSLSRGSQEDEQPRLREVEDVTYDLRPLMFWMTNSIELLNFAQKKVAEMEKECESVEVEGFSHDSMLSTDFESCEEAMVLLDEVIIYTFQQCVYYLTKTLYSALPGLLDTNPFASNSNPGDVQELSGMPEGVRNILAVYQTTFDLSRQYQMHPDLVSQMFGYLFFFCNASVFNTLMERGDGGSFYQWARGVQIRTNLDLVLDWLQGVGLGDIAAEYFRKLSAIVNLLCIPKTNLLKLSWTSLQGDHSALSRAQLNHVLSNYHLGPSRSRPTAWDMTPSQADKPQKGEIFESFTDHPPLILPAGNFRLCLSEPVPSEGFYLHLQHLRQFVWEREKQRLPANQRTVY